jgi:hypothetical protein
VNWIGDWVGYVDGINSMGYDGLSGGGCGEVWQPYRWQQDMVLAAGYRCDQFDMGLPGWTGNWGCGGLGTSTLATSTSCDREATTASRRPSRSGTRSSTAPAG